MTACSAFPTIYDTLVNLSEIKDWNWKLIVSVLLSFFRREKKISSLRGSKWRIDCTSCGCDTCEETRKKLPHIILVAWWVIISYVNAREQWRYGIVCGRRYIISSEVFNSFQFVSISSSFNENKNNKWLVPRYTMHLTHSFTTLYCTRAYNDVKYKKKNTRQFGMRHRIVWQYFSTRDL